MTQKLNAKALALALGIMWSLGVLFLSIDMYINSSDDLL